MWIPSRSVDSWYSVRKGDKTMLFSICIPSYNRGHRAYELVCELLQENDKSRQIEVICSNNGSEKNREGYEALRLLQDERFVYHEFPTNRGFAENVNQVIKMAKGDFCLLLSDEDRLLSDNLGNYIKYLEQHPEIGVMKACTSLAYSDLKTQYIDGVQSKEKIDAYYMWGNYISGTIYNRNVIDNELVDYYAMRYRENEAYRYYVHLFFDTFALLCGSFCSSDLLLVEEGIPADSFLPAQNSPDATVPEFGTYDSRLRQMHGFLQQVKDFDIPATLQFQMFIRVLERTAEQINLQKKKYIAHGDSWNEIMQQVSNTMKEEIAFLELPFGKEDIVIIEEHIDRIVLG